MSSLPASVSGNTVFSIIALWELSVAMETKVLIRSGPKPNAAFPYHNDASDKISLVAEIFMFENVEDVRRQTDAGAWVYFTFSSPMSLWLR